MKWVSSCFEPYKTHWWYTNTYHLVLQSLPVINYIINHLIYSIVKYFIKRRWLIIIWIAVFFFGWKWEVYFGPFISSSWLWSSILSKIREFGLILQLFRCLSPNSRLKLGWIIILRRSWWGEGIWQSVINERIIKCCSLFIFNKRIVHKNWFS